MRSKKKPTAIGPTCTQGGHNPLPPSGTCPQSNETFIFPGLLYQLLIKSELIKYDEKLIFVLCFVN
jgi:hypothetical protein